MKKYLILLSMGLALLVAACKEKAEDGTAVLPRFVISDVQLESWEEGQDFVKLTLTEEAGNGFAELTKENLNKKIDVYYGDHKLMSPEIRSAATPPDVYLMGLDDAGKKDIIKRLPPEKDDADRTAP